MDYVLVYVWWGTGSPIYDLANPILLSIGTFRASNPDSTPIYVIDYSNRDWEDWPVKLNFKVIQQTPFFNREHFPQLYPRIMWNLCSKPFNVFHLKNQFPHRNILLSDTDVLWRRPYDFPDSNTLKWYTHNSGILTFDLNAAAVQELFAQWEKLLKNCFHSIDLITQITKNQKFPLQEEVTLFHLAETHPDLVQTLPKQHNYLSWFFTWGKEIFDPAAYNVHLAYLWKHSMYWHHRRGQIAWYIQETRDLLLSKFSWSDALKLSRLPLHKLPSYQWRDFQQLLTHLPVKLL